MTKRNQLIYALKDGVATSIENVESGLKCGCICPSCGEPLVAKKGSKRMHHFSHYSGHNCEYGYETSLHLAAKEILSTANRIMLPAVYIQFPNSPKAPELYCESKEISIERVELEKRFQDVIPDVVIYAGGKQLFLEVYVTHTIDDIKLKKLKQADISTIEIDLSKKEHSISLEELRSILLDNSEEKKWVYNSIANKYLGYFYAAADQRDVISRSFAFHVDNCPIKARTWHGKPYANFIDDCNGCKYCISYQFEGGMLCSGRRRVATVADLRTPENERIDKSNKEITESKNRAFAKGYCPNCGGKLVERAGPFGTFWGCINYPHCRFKAAPDPQTGEIKFSS